MELFSELNKCSTTLHESLYIIIFILLGSRSKVHGKKKTKTCLKEEELNTIGHKVKLYPCGGCRGGSTVL
jgi:hypothetical protein